MFGYFYQITNFWLEISKKYNNIFNTSPTIISVCSTGTYSTLCTSRLYQKILWVCVIRIWKCIVFQVTHYEIPQLSPNKYIIYCVHCYLVLTEVISISTKVLFYRLGSTLYFPELHWTSSNYGCVCICVICCNFFL